MNKNWSENKTAGVCIECRQVRRRRNSFHSIQRYARIVQSAHDTKYTTNANKNQTQHCTAINTARTSVNICMNSRPHAQRKGAHSSFFNLD